MDPVKPCVIFSRQFREDDWTHSRNANLSAMRVSRELQVNRKFRNEVGIIGLMRQEQSCFSWGHGRQRPSQVRFPFADVIDSGDPKSFSLALYGERFIPQNSNSPFVKSRRDEVSTVPMIVIPKDRNLTHTAPASNCVRAWFSEMGSGWAISPSQWAGNKISRKSK